jgi:hypothetical protein
MLKKIIFISISSLILSCSNNKEDSIKYTIKLATYVNIPDSIQKLIDSSQLNVLVTESSEHKLNSIYSSNSFPCHKDALLEKEKWVNKGYNDSFIVAFKNEKQILTEDAKKQTKNECDS